LTLVALVTLPDFHLITGSRWVACLAVPFLVGCIQVPPIRVIYSPQPRQRWEYACVKPGVSEDITSEANKYGQEGWELAAADGTVWCFKRPVDPPVRVP
jgi:hypothetical protein